MKNTKKLLTDSLILGAALFSMFFGAGNMIFPPFLGLESGNQWLTGFFCFFIFDVGLATLTFFAQIKTDGFENILKPLGNFFALVVMLSVVVCLGPLISIPRTAATTYELSVLPLWENMNMVLFCILFFLVVLILSIKESAVVDIVGKILTPVLFFGLLYLIILGVLNPLGEISQMPKTQSVPVAGIEAGYQSLDVLGAAVFGILILGSAKERGHISKKSRAIVSGNASVIAAIGLFVIYLGLTYLGATVSDIYTTHTPRSTLLSNIITRLSPGTWGTAFFALIAALACLSTAIAITSASAEYFSRITKNKISYKVFVIIICILGVVLSLLGVDNIVYFASPVLNIVYPPVLVLVIVSLFGDFFPPLSYRLSALFAFLISLGSILKIDFLLLLPLASLGLNWFIPSVLGAFLGKFISNKQSNAQIS